MSDGPFRNPTFGTNPKVRKNVGVVAESPRNLTLSRRRREETDHRYETMAFSISESESDLRNPAEFAISLFEALVFRVKTKPVLPNMGISWARISGGTSDD